MTPRLMAGAVAIATALAAASTLDSGLLAPYVRAMQAAEGIDVKYSVNVVGGTLSEFRVALARPNKALIDSATTTVYADGTNVTTHFKTSNTYIVKKQLASSVQAMLSGEHFSLWMPYLDAKAFDSVTSTKNEGTRTRKGETLNLVSAQLDASGRSTVRLHLGQRDNTVRQAEFTDSTSASPVTTILTVESLSTSKVASDVFTFRAPTGSKLLTDRELRIAEYTKMIKVERSATSLAQKPNVTFTPVRADKQSQLDALLVMMVDEFSKYPLDFIKASKLKQILVVDQLMVSGQHRAALPAASLEAVVYDVSFTTSSWYMHYVIHHEFFHNLEEEWNGSFYYKDPKWAAFNEPGFKYKGGAAEAYASGQDVTSFTHPQRGFINLYSTYGMEEDRADIWAAMFVPEIWKKVAPMVAGDPILQAKVRYLREFARSKCPEMDDAFWKQVSGETPTS